MNLLVRLMLEHASDLAGPMPDDLRKRILDLAFSADQASKASALSKEFSDYLKSHHPALKL